MAQRESSWRLESCSLRSTAETWVSTVFTLRTSSRAISLWVSPASDQTQDVEHSRDIST